MLYFWCIGFKTLNLADFQGKKSKMEKKQFSQYLAKDGAIPRTDQCCKLLPNIGGAAP